MSTLRNEVSMGFTQSRFPEGTHMCLIYDNDSQCRKIISRFLSGGLASGEQVGYFADSSTPEEVRYWLKEMGVSVPNEGPGGPFNVYTAEKVYCPCGKFVPSEMLAKLKDFYTTAITDGYKGVRVSGEMSWALKNIPGSECLMEYEALVNTILEEYPVTPICQYDARRFNGTTLLNVLRVHPMMIVNGQIVHNPYYMKPEDFLTGFRSIKGQQ